MKTTTKHKLGKISKIQSYYWPPGIIALYYTCTKTKHCNFNENEILFKPSIPLVVGWSERAWWQGQPYPHLWDMQRLSKAASPWQLVGHSVPAQLFGSSDLCHAALFCTWLCQPALTLAVLQGDTHTLLQAGQFSERTGANLERWGERHRTTFLKCWVYKSRWILISKWHIGLLVFATEKPVEYSQIMKLRLR